MNKAGRKRKYNSRQLILILQFYIANELDNANQLKDQLNVSENICKELVKEYKKSGNIIIKSRL